MAHHKPDEDLDEALALALMQAEIDREVEWEMAAIDAGVERYRRSVSTDFADSHPGRIIQNDMMRQISPAIAKVQGHYADRIVTPEKAKSVPKWVWPILTLPADVLAFLTIRTLIVAPHTDNGQGRTATAVALNIAMAIRDQVEYTEWRKQSKARAKETGERDFATVLVLRAGGKDKVDRKRWRTWRRKIAEIPKQNWTKSQRLSMGALLLKLAIKNGGGWFEERNVRVKSKTEKRIFLSEAAVRAIGQINSEMEARRPVLPPMLIKPRRWHRVEVSN